MSREGAGGVWLGLLLGLWLGLLMLGIIWLGIVHCATTLQLPNTVENRKYLVNNIFLQKILSVIVEHVLFGQLIDVTYTT